MGQVLPSGQQGSITRAMFWMMVISLLLFWLPLLGPAIAGFVGGRKAGGVGPAVTAALLPAILLGATLFVLASALTGFPLLGVIAGLGGTAIALAHVGPLLLGAIIGGAVA
jgi:hypothetical protein